MPTNRVTVKNFLNQVMPLSPTQPVGGWTQDWIDATAALIEEYRQAGTLSIAYAAKLRPWVVENLNPTAEQLAYLDDRIAGL